jgi:tetratricopeptide (TPR) repeat protein
MNAQVSPDERAQILQTVEMFEVITQSNPRDCQSLEILKEAYNKLGRETDAISVMRRLADTYMELGQYSSALLEYEGILQKFPDSPDILARMGEVEGRMSESAQPNGAPHSEPEGINLDFASVIPQDPTLITTSATRKPETHHDDAARALANDGNDALAKFLNQHRLAPDDLVASALAHVRRANKKLDGEALAASLIDELGRSKIVERDTLLCGILDRTKFAYVPLDCYDVDRQIVKMLPEHLTLGRLIVPFDLISRTIMIAMANPFDAPGKEAVQQLLDYNIQWHLASPEAIFKVLRDAYRLAGRE